MDKTLLITGAARRIGASCAKLMHGQGFRVLLHYQHSKDEAIALVDSLNRIRPNSAKAFAADLTQQDQIRYLASCVMNETDHLDGLINNAAQFFPGEFTTVDEAGWDSLFASNLKAPFFLTQSLLPLLVTARGAVINIVDIYGQRALPGYSVYSITKAALIAMTQSLAKELGPSVRVNAIAPGAILWPESGANQTECEALLAKVALGRMGEPDDIAKAVRYLLLDAPYVTGQILAIDGGRSLVI